MKNKAISILIALGLLLAACAAPSPSPVTEPPQPTQEPVPTSETVPTNPPPTEPISPSEPAGEQPGEVQLIRSDIPRDIAPQVSNEELETLVSGNTQFALDLYRSLLDENENIFFSPFSISQALTMAYAGARGETEQQMAEALNNTLPQDRLHPAMNALDLSLSERDAAATPEDGDIFELHVANAIWGQEGYTFLADFLDVLAQNYGAGLRTLNFEAAPEESRHTINQWVSDETNQKIEDLLPQGSISELTRMVLTNAIYFNASWLNQFEEDQTQDGEFTLLDGSQVQVPLMHQTEFFGYADGEGYQAVELPYLGQDMSMVIFLPDEGSFPSFERELSAQTVDGILAELRSTNLDLAMPKFSFDSSFQLTQMLSELGMPAAFNPGEANFEGMDGTRDLLITGVFHKAFVDVDETGTEAAAATGLVVGITSMPPEPITVSIDRPFIFFIVDRQTNTLLFVGRVLNPSI